MLGNNGGGTSGMACSRQLLVFHQWQWFSGVGASMPGIMRCMRQSCVAGAACGSLWFFINGSGSVAQWDGHFDGRHHVLQAAVVLLRLHAAAFGVSSAAVVQ